MCAIELVRYSIGPSLSNTKDLLLSSCALSIFPTVCNNVPISPKTLSRLTLK